MFISAIKPLLCLYQLSNRLPLYAVFRLIPAIHGRARDDGLYG